MNRKKGYIIIVSLIFVSLLLMINNYIDNPYENQKNYLDHLKTSDSIAVYSPTGSTVVDLIISTLVTVEWSSGVAAACEIHLFDFSIEVEYLGMYTNIGRAHPGYINSNTVDLSSDLEPGEYYRIKLIDVNDEWNYDYSDFFTILNDAYNPTQVEDPTPLDDPTDSINDNFFMVLVIILIVAPIGIAITVIITRFTIKRSEIPKPRTKSSIKVLKNHTFNILDEVYDLINQDQVEQASIKFEEIQKFIIEKNNPKLKQIFKTKITYIKPIIDNHKIRKIKKVVLDLGIKVSLLELEEIIERTNIRDEKLIENVIDDMIKNSEIFAEYRGSIKTLFFDIQENTETIDRLMKTYRDWEKTHFSKKI